METREAVKETAESATIYELNDKFIPASKLQTGDQEYYSTLREFDDRLIESGAIRLHLDFLRAFDDKKEAEAAAKQKWGPEINLDTVKLNQQFAIVSDQNGPVAVKEIYLDTNGSLIEEQTKILKQGQLGKQDPAYALATVDASLQKGNFTQKPCTEAEFREFQRPQIIPLPSIFEIDLIRERQSRYGEQEILPEADNNIAGRADIEKDIMLTDDWLKAKAGDREAAGRIINTLWSPKKTEKFLEMTGDQNKVVFVTMPSTSGFNVMPEVLGQKLVQELGRKSQVILGDEYFNVTHAAEIKNISRFDRIFTKRKYKLAKPFENGLQEKKIVLLDDVFTTGGSVKDFSSALAENGLKVSHVAGLMGDKRLRNDQKTVESLENAIKEKNMDVDINRLKNLLTRTEAGLLIQTINREGLKNEKLRELTGRIQGLYKGLFIKDITGDRNTGRDQSLGRAYPDNARDAKRVQDRGSRGQGQGR